MRRFYINVGRSKTEKNNSIIYDSFIEETIIIVNKSPHQALMKLLNGVFKTHKVLGIYTIPGENGLRCWLESTD